MSRAGRAAGLALLACCLGLAAYLGVWALDESTRRGETVELALRPAPTAAPRRCRIRRGWSSTARPWSS